MTAEFAHAPGEHEYGEPEPWGLAGGHVIERCTHEGCSAYRVMPVVRDD